MSDEKVDGQDNSANNDAVDPIKQIKSEFGRKQDNVMNELNALKAQLGQIADTVITAAATKRQSSEDESMPDPVMDPKGYRDHLKKDLRREVDASLNSERERNQTLASLVSQYPELQDGNSELTQQALRIYQGLSNSEKQSPSAYKLAVMQAAQEVGVLPANKRQSKKQEADDESFTMNSGGSSNARRPSQNRKEEKLDERTLEFARALGRPVDDPKYMESLKKTVSSRKRSWSKFE